MTSKKRKNILPLLFSIYLNDLHEFFYDNDVVNSVKMNLDENVFQHICDSLC